MGVDKYYDVFNCRTPIPHKYVNYQYITIVSEPGVNPASKYVPPDNSKEKFWKEPPIHADYG